MPRLPVSKIFGLSTYPKIGSERISSLYNIIIYIQEKSIMSIPAKKEKEQALALTIGSSVASMIGKIVTHPIDTIKAKLQVNRLQMRTLSDVKPGMAIDLGIYRFTTS